MEMMIVEAWAGEQLLVVLGTGVTIEEDLFEGQSWTMRVVLLITVAVVLQSCAGIVHYGHLPTGRTVTREPEVAKQQSRMNLRSMRAKSINHVKERTWSLSRYSGDQLWQLMMVMLAWFCRDSLEKVSRRIAIMSEDRNTCGYEYRVDSEFFGCTVCDDCLYRSMLWSRDRIHTQALGEEWTKEDDDVKSFSLLKDWNTEFKIEYDNQMRARKIKLVELSSVPQAQQWYDGGGTSSGNAGEVTGSMRLRELPVGSAELF